MSNLLSRKMDDEIAKYCNDNGFVYSRYADDITISSKEWNKVPSFDEVRKIVDNNGHRQNHKKTRLSHKGQKMEVTGLIVGNGVHVSKTYRNEILRVFHFCERLTPAVHSKKQYPDKMFYKEWLLGRIRFVKSVDESTGRCM